MSRVEKKIEKHAECYHDWKPIGTTKGYTHLKLMCTKCGETQLIELFP
jgi:hypothetical protein